MLDITAETKKVREDMEKQGYVLTKEEYHGAKPDRCEQCIWCRDTKVLTKPIGIGDLTASL